jgi:LemA protein
MYVFITMLFAMKKILLGLLVVVVLLVGAGFKFYNGTLTMSEQIDSLSKQVDNMYDRRSSLVPQLAAVVKKYTEYESGTLTEIVKLREPLNQLQGMVAK